MARQKGLSIQLAGDWQKFHIVAASFQGKLSNASMFATKRAMLYVLSKIDERIREGRYKKLSPLTKLMRDMEGYGDTPLLRRGGLVRALSTDLKGAFEGHVGLLKQVKGKGGTKDFTNIGPLLHDGGRIKITQKMRVAFARRLNRLAAKNGVSLLNQRGSKKNVMRIPPRPFMAEVFDDPAVIMEVERIYYDAIRQFMKV